MGRRSCCCCCGCYCCGCGRLRNNEFNWQNEFDCKHFGFQHNKPHVFVTSQIGPILLYPIWTAIALVYHLTALAVDGYQTTDKVGEITANYFLYLPNWSYILLTVYAFYDCVTTLYVHLVVPGLIQRQGSNNSSIEVAMRNMVVKFDLKTLGEMPDVVPWYLKVGWALFTLATPVAIIVSLTYWVTYFLDTYADNQYVKVHVIEATLLKEKTLDFGSLAFHAINGFMALLHILISAKPFRLLHFYFSLSFFVIYVIFTVIYQLITGDNIYKSVDWSDTFFTLSAMAGYLIFVPFLVHLFIHVLVQFRTMFGNWCQLWGASRRIKRKRQAEHWNSQREPVTRRLTRRNSKVTPVDEEMVFYKRKAKEKKNTKDESEILGPVSTVAHVSEKSSVSYKSQETSLHENISTTTS